MAPAIDVSSPGQSLHVALPGSALKLPGVQGMHDSWPEAGCAEPAGQAKQAVAADAPA